MTDQATTIVRDEAQATTTTVTATTDIKPGWKTTEFYLASAAKLLGVLFASGLVGDGSLAARIAGLAAMALTALGYSVSRAIVKAAAVVLFLAIASSSTLACTAGQRAAVAKAAWDCTAPERAEAVAALTPLADSVIVAAASADGKLVDPSKLKAAFAKANLLSDAGALLTCALASATAALIAHPAAPTTGAAGLTIEPAALRAAFDQVRADQFPGATLKTASGAI